jgi:ribosome production factor 1
MITANPADPNKQPDEETNFDISTDPFADYFASASIDADPMAPRKVLITTSPRSTKGTYEFCEELVSIFPGAELIRRKKGKGFEIGRIASWAANRGYHNMIVVNEDAKMPSRVSSRLSLHKVVDQII